MAEGNTSVMQVCMKTQNDIKIEIGDSSVEPGNLVLAKQKYWRCRSQIRRSRGRFVLNYIVDQPAKFLRRKSKSQQLDVLCRCILVHTLLHGTKVSLEFQLEAILSLTGATPLHHRQLVDLERQ
jgi:hypothetical protein